MLVLGNCMNMGMLFIGAFAYSVRPAVRILLVRRFDGGADCWSFGQSCGNVQELGVFGQVVLEFEQLDLTGHIDELLLLQSAHLREQHLLATRARYQPADEITQQLIFY